MKHIAIPYSLLFVLFMFQPTSCNNAFGEPATDIAYRAHAEEQAENWCEALKLYTKARKESGKKDAYQKQIYRTKKKCDAEKKKKKKKKVRKKREEAKRKKDAEKKREEEATEQKRKEGEARKKPIEVISKNGVVMDLVPAGEFTMGYDKGEDREKPEHSVYLDDYYIDRYEVTVAQYRKCVEAKSCKEDNFYDYDKEHSWEKYCNYGQTGRDKHPMNCVSWRGLKDYCEWSGKRLPTEAEWEKAARSTDKRRYPWGSTPEPGCDYAVIPEGGDGCGKYRTFEVGNKPKSVGPYGTHDLVGNVWEWCSDWYCDDYYSKSPKKNPKGCKKNNYKVLRGGSWSWSVGGSSFRSHNNPVHWNGSGGGRCVQD